MSMMRTRSPIFSLREELLLRAAPVVFCFAASLLFIFDIHVFGVDHAFVFLLALTVAAVATCGCARRWTARCRSRSRLSSLVHLLGQLVRSLGQRFASLVHGCLVIRLQGLLGIGNGVLNISAF